MAKAGEKHTVHWFRKGLRLHDNPSLKEGLAAATTFRCVFIIDPWFAGTSNVGINKWRFLLQCLEDLDRNLKKLNSRLFVVRGQPADALPKLFKEWGTTSLTFEEDPEPFGRVRDHNIMAMCREIGIDVISKVSHTLYKLDKIIENNGGRAPLTYHQFQTVISRMNAPSTAESTITPSNIGKAVTPVKDDHDEKYGVPTLEELGFDTDGLLPPVWIGGESEALARLERHLERKAWVASFGKPKMTPQSLLASQTGLSPYLRFGCLSTRLFYYQLTDLYKKIKRSLPPLSLHGQLLWREFFYCAATKNPNFDKMVGNPICVQIPWDTNNDALAKWANGQTGFPWIDAIMIQLREEGWIHHLARHAVACFLTRGDLWISWEEGMKVFEELLLDADWSVNAGTWMWLSCSSFFRQFFHCYCPVRFGRKADPHGDYIRKYIPILRNFPIQYIHAPWTAPRDIQENARCVIGQDYPLPMIDHAIAARVNIQRIKQVYRKLSKYKTGESMIIDNINQSNMPASSPSPNSIILNVNHSNYLCNTITENKNFETDFQHNENNDEQKCASTNSKFGKDYENDESILDIFKNQQHDNTSLQICNIPFKKIVVIEQKYVNNDKDQIVDNKNENYSIPSHNHDFGKNKETNCNHQKQYQQKPNYCINQQGSFKNFHLVENEGYNTQMTTQRHLTSKKIFGNTSKSEQTFQSMYCCTPVSSYKNQLFNADGIGKKLDKIGSIKSSSNLNSNCAKEQQNEKKIFERDRIYGQVSQQLNSNYNFNTQDVEASQSSVCMNQYLNMYTENTSRYNSSKNNSNQRSERVETNNQDCMNISTYSTANNVKTNKCTLEEEKTYFDEGKILSMQSDHGPKI